MRGWCIQPAATGDVDLGHVCWAGALGCARKLRRELAQFDQALFARQLFANPVYWVLRQGRRLRVSVIGGGPVEGATDSDSKRIDAAAMK